MGWPRPFVFALIAASGMLPLGAAEFFVSPSGSAFSDGSLAAPWDLSTALAHPASVHPGDIIWLRGGTYSGSFRSTLTGAPGQPVIVRQFPGERATLDYPSTSPTELQVLKIDGAWTWYWGLEITCSWSQRIDPPRERPTGVNVYGPNVKLINLVIHDAFGVGFWMGSDNSEMNGNLIYNNGYQAQDRGHGHGIYSQNRVGERRIVDNIVFQSFSHGLHIYGSEQAYLDNYRIEGNAIFNNGALSSFGDERNILLGGGQQAQNPVLISNYTYWSNQLTTGQNNFGYVAGCNGLTLQNNYFTGGTAALLVNCPGVAVTGNTFAGSVNGLSAATFPSNTYFPYGTRPTGTHVFVRRNQFEEGRAHIVVFNWGLESQVSADLSSILRSGQGYEIRDAQNYYGDPIVRAVYHGGSIPLPMTLTAVSQPVGGVPVPPVHTPGEFGVFVVHALPDDALAPPASITPVTGTAQSAKLARAFATPLQVVVRDASDQPMSGVVVTFSTPPAGASAALSSGVAITNAVGLATTTATANLNAGSYNIVASVAGGAAPAAFALTNTIGIPAAVAITQGSPQSAAIQASYATALRVRVTDTAGDPVAGVAVTFNAPASGASAFLITPLAFTDALGLASTAALANPVAGSFNVTASAGGASLATFALTNTAGGPASIGAVAGMTQSAAANTAFGVSLQVLVRDANGNPVGGATVLFSTPATGPRAVISPATRTTGADGIATAPVTAGTLAGSYNVTASVTGVVTPALFVLTNTAGAASAVSATGGTPQAAAIRSAFATPLQATVKDAFGNPVAGATVLFSTPATGAGATLLSSQAITNLSGVATAVPTANSVAGAYAVTATVSGGSTAATFTLTNAQGAAASLAVTAGSPQTRAVGLPFAAALQVAVKDAGNNPVSGVVVTFAPPAFGAGAVLSAATATTNTAGLASITAAANGIAGTYAVTASVNGAPTGVSFVLTNTPGPAASVTAFGGAGQTAPVGSAFGAPVQVLVADSAGNPVSGVTVAFAPPPLAAGPSAALSTASALTNAAGIAAVTATANSTQGSYMVNATVPGVATPAAISLTNLAISGTSHSAVFLGADSVTQGSWKTRYGAEGYFIPNAGTSYPSYATVSMTGSPYTWVTNVPPGPGAGDRAVERPGATTRIGSTVLDQVAVQIDLNLTDGQVHRVGFYMADWQSGNVATFTMRDFETSAPFDTQYLPAYRTGQWLVYLLRGHVVAKLTRTGGSWAQLAGIFFGPGEPGTLSATGGTTQSASVSSPFGAPLSAAVRDAAGNPVSGTTVTFAGPASGPGAALSQVSAVSNTSGVASVAAVANSNIGGPYTVSASAQGAGSPVTFSLTNTAGASATLTVTTGSPQSASVTTAFGAPLQVAVKDAAGNPVQSAVVHFVAPAAGASAALSAATATTDASGIASITATANSLAGAYSVTASVVGVPAPAIFSLTNLAGAPTAILASGGAAQSTAAGAAFASALTATVRDAFGNPVPGAQVSFTPPATGPSAVLSAGAATTDLSGIASVTAVANNLAGSYLVAATMAGASAPATFALTNTSGTAVSVTAMAGTPQTTTPGNAFPIALQAAVRDAAGNPVSGILVNFSGPGAGAGALFQPPNAATNAAGVASATATANTALGAYTATASVAGIATPASFTLSNVTGAAASLGVLGGTNQAVGNGLAFSIPLSVQVRDAGNNPISGAVVTFAVPSTGPSAILPMMSATTDASGIASVTATANTLAGPYTVTASTAGVASAALFALTNLPGAPASIALSSGSGQSIGVNQPFAGPLSVVVRDTAGNPVPGVVVVYTPPAVGPSAALASASAVTNASGVASVAATANATVGSYQVSAAAPGLSTPATFALVNIPGAPASIAVNGGASQTVQVNGAFALPLEAIVRDLGNNPVPGVTVTFTAPATGAGAALSSSTALTNAQGIATVTATANRTAGVFNISAAAAGVATPASFALSSTPGPASVIALTGAATRSASIGAAFAAPLQVVVRDADGNPVAGVAVTFASPATGATANLSALTGTTNASGLASVTATANATLGTYSVTAAAAGVAAGVSFTLTNTAGPPAQAALFAGGSQTAQINAAFPAPLQVRVDDASGNPVQGVTVSFAAPASGATAALSAGTALTNASGVAGVTATAGATAGSFNVTASVAGVASPVLFTLTTAPAGPASIAAVAGSPQTAVAGSAFSVALQVKVLDASANPVPGVTVDFAVPAAGPSAALSAPSVTTDAAGIASVTATANGTAGTYQVSATVSGVATPALLALTNAAGPAAALVVSSGSPQTAGAGVAFGAPLQVIARDAHDNPVPGVTISFAAPAAEGASAVLSAATATTNASGIAAITANANGVIGSYQVSATTPGVATPAVFALTNAVGAPASLVAAAGSAQSAAVGAGFSTALQVIVRDTGNNPVPGVTVTFAPPSTGASAVLSSPTSVTDASGLASVTATANAVAGSYSVSATAAGVAAPAAFALTNTAGPPASLAVSGGSPQSAAIGATFTTTLQAIVLDAGNNPVAGVVVNFAAPASGPSALLSAASATTNAAGVAAVTATANTVTGAFNVAATAAGGFSASFALTNTAGAPASMTLVAGSPQTAAIGSAFALPLQVAVYDIANNAVPGVSVTFTVPATGASATLTSQTASTNAAGLASVSATANTIAGAFDVAASAGALTAAFHLTISAGAPGSVTVLAGSPQTAAVGTAYGTPLRAIVRDAGNNPVSGVTVTFAVPASGPSATLTAATVVTNAAGEAEVNATANAVTGSFQVSASVNALSASFALTNTAGAPATIAVLSGSPQSAVTGTAYAAPLQAVVRDAGNNPVPGVTVTFAAPGTGASATLSSPTAVTDALGVASITASANAVAGAFNVTASAGALTVPFAITNLPPPPASIRASYGISQGADVGTAFSNALEVTVKDAANLPVSGVPVNFAAPGSAASATLSAATATTDAFGKASVTATANAVSGGPYTVTANVAGVAAPATFALTNTTPASSAPSTVTSTLDVKTYSINAFNATYDGQWQGTFVASDGKVYFGAASHTPGHGAGFFRFDPAAQTITVLAEDISRVVGEDPTLTPSQGKIHSQITEHNGWLYFGTHSSNYDPASLVAYTGGHLIGYNMANGQFRDYGVMKANHTIYSGIVLDAAREKFYVFTTPNAVGFSYGPAPANNRPQLWRVDLTTGQKESLGSVSTTGDASLQMFVDTGGNLWMQTLGDRGLYRVRPGASAVERIAIPAQYNFFYMLPMPGNAKALVSYQDRNALGFFDPAQPIASAFQDIATLPDGVHAIELSRDGTTAYYVTGPLPASGGNQLRSVNLSTGVVTGLGYLKDQQGRLPWRVNGIAASANKLYLVGDWQRLAGDPPSIRNGVARVSDGAGMPVTMRVAEVSLSFASLTPTGGTAQSAGVNSAFATPLEVTLKDAGNQPIAGALVTFSAPASGASASFALATATTNSSGVASVTATANASVGAYVVTASANGISTAFGLANIPGPPATLAATSGNMQTVAVNTAFPVALALQVRDTGNNPVPGAVVTFAAPATGASAVLSAASATADAAGNASVMATANGVAGPYVVVAAVGGVTADFSLTNTAGAATQAVATGGTPQSAAINAAFAEALRVTVRDAGNNPVAGVAITFATPSSGAGAALSSNTVTTDAAGQASVTATANSVAGAYAVTASAAGVATPASFALTNTAGAAAQVSATGGATQSAAVNAAFGAELQVTVRDAGNNPVSGVTVTFAAPASGATAVLLAPTATTNASGIASVTATANASVGAYNVTASVAGVATPAAFALTNTAGAAAQVSAIGGTPQSSAINTAFASPLQVAVRDAGNNPVSGVTVTFATPATGAGALLSAATAITDASGLASVTATANATAGAYNVTASVGALSAAFALTNTPGPATRVTAIGGTPQSAAAGMPFATALQVTVHDAGNNPVSGATVTFTAPTSGASAALSSATAVTNESGVASVSATANSTAGTYEITAATGTATTAAFSLTNTAGAAAQITATTGTPQTVAINTLFAAALQVTVLDASNNPVAGATVTFAAPTSGAGATLSAPTAITNASGVASVTATANASAGSYNVTASAGALSATFALTNMPGPASQTAASAGTPQSALVNAAFGLALQVTVRDAGNNPVPGATVTFAAPASGASAVLLVTTATTSAAGTASVTATANAIAGAYNVTATAGGATASFALTNTAGAATQMSATGGTPQSAAISTAFAGALQVTIQDAGNNPVPGVTVTFTVPASGAGAAVSSGTAITNNAGIASVAATANATAGAYQLTASAGALSAVFSLTNTAGAPAQVTATGGTPQTAVINTAFATALRVSVHDAGNNPVSGATVTFAAPLNGASAALSSTAATTDALGVATVTATANATAGAFNITASSGAASTTFALTNTAGAATQMAAAGGTPQSSGINTLFSTPLQVIVRDAGNNPVAGVTVTFAAPASGGATATLSSFTATTNAAGAASVTATANAVAGSYEITASSGGLTASFALSNTAGPASQIAIAGGTPQSAVIGAPFATPLEVIVRDAGNNPVAGAAVTFAAPGSGASAVFSAVTATTNAAGLASITASANTAAGVYNVTASAGAASAVFAMTNTPGAAAQLAALGGTPQSATVSTAFTTPLQVRVRDTGNNAVAGATVTFAAPTSGASAALSAITATTDASGLAAISAAANAIAGAYNITATVGSASVSFALTNTAGAVAQVLATGGTPQSATINSPFGAPLQVTARDAGNNPVAGVTVSFIAPATGARASLSSATAVTNAAGLATVNATAGSTAGAYIVNASVGGVSTEFALTNTTGAAAQVTATGGTPQSTAAGAAFGTPLQVVVRDAGNNPVSGATVNFLAPATGASAVLSPASAVTDAAGTASIAATANATAGVYQVTATVGGAPAAVFALTNTPGPATQMTASAGTPQSAAINTVFAVPLQITVRDSGNNPVPGVTITFSAPASGATASLSAATATTNAAGLATISATANATVGAYSVTAASGALNATFALSNTVGAASQVTAAAGTPQSTTVSTAFGTALQVTVRDAGDNPVSGVTVTFTAPASGASAAVSPATAVTNGAGVVSVNATANPVAGLYNITASAGTGSATFALTNLAGAPAQLAAFAGTPQTAPIGTAFATPLQAIVRDAAGNPVSGATVNFAAPSSGATAALASSTAVTNAAGVASIAATAGNVTGTYTVSASLGTFSASFAMTNTAGPPASIAPASGTPQTANSGSAFAGPLQALVRDAGGNPVAGAVVSFSAPASGASATLSSTTATTNTAGIASVTALANSTAGGYTVSASVPGAPAAAAFSLTNTLPVGGTNSVVYLSADNVTQGAWRSQYGADGYYIANLANSLPAYATFAVTAGTPYTWDSNPAGPEAVRALDKPLPPGRFASAVIDGTKLEFDLNLNDGLAHRVAFYMTDWTSSTSMQTVSILDATTQAVLDTQTVTGFRAGRWLIYSIRGHVIVRTLRTAGSWVQINGVFFGNSASGALTVNGGSPQSAAINSPFGTPLSVSVRDAANAPVSGVTVSFAAPTGAGAGAALSSTTAITNASGIASVTATANNVTGSFNVTASAIGSTVTFALTNTAGAAASLAVTAGTSQSAAIGAAFTTPLQVTARDAGGNPVSGVTVSFVSPSTGASAALSAASAVTNASGVASVNATANNVIGSYQVTASAAGIAAPALFALTNTVGSPASITATGGTPQSTTSSTAFASPLQATVRDAAGNPLTGVTVQFSAPGSGATATLSASSAVTNAAGVASVAATASGSQGTYTVTAAVSGLATTASYSLTNNQAPGGGATSATLLASDNTTKGNWKAGGYGPQGYFIPNHATTLPSWVTMTFTGTSYTWDGNPAGPEAERALERVTPPGRFASAVIGESQFQFNLNLTDGAAHRVAFYMTDWISSTATQRITVLNAATNAVLDTQDVTSYRAGRWLVYSLRGNVIVRVQRTGGNWAQINGIFFGP